MILKGLNKRQLEECLESCQGMYDNNLMFSRLDLSGYAKNVKGIEATVMEDAAIIAKDNGKPVVIPVFSWNEYQKHLPNPFVKGQFYSVIKGGASNYRVDVYWGNKLYMEAYLKEPRYVIDFLKHNINPNQITFTLRVRNSKKAGHRVGFHFTAEGNRRKLVSACWHVHRDVMMKIFEMNPEAKLKTAHVYYKGKDDFYEKYEETGYRNVGSEMFPVDMQDLCECHGDA